MMTMINGDVDDADKVTNVGEDKEEEELSNIAAVDNKFKTTMETM